MAQGSERSVAKMVVAAAVVMATMCKASPTTSTSDATVASVVWQNGVLTLKPGVLDPTAAAYGSLKNGSVGGWSTLDVAANPHGCGGNATESYRAAGTLEAALTCWHIGLFARNNDDPQGGKNARVAAFTEQSMKWVRGMVASNSSDYWVQVGNVLAQFDGMVDGYQRYCAQSAVYTPLTATQMLFMQMDGDLEDLQSAFVGRSRRSSVTQSQNWTTGLRCSMLAKLTEDKKDLYFGHATWDSFSNMNPRVYKTYHLPVVRRGQQSVHTVSFSSSPSWIASIDDWYVTNGTSSLVVIETSHSIRNTALYKKLSQQTVFSWIRSVVANALASDGAEWAALFSAYHSGTYNNEWQVIDLTKFTPGADPEAGLLTIVEEVPGLMHSADMTETMVSTSVWMSFNVPWFADIQREAGYQKSDWTDDPRHCLLQQLQTNVSDSASMESVIRHNNFQHDKCSGRDPCSGAVACRDDLGLVPQMFGALDAKWSSWSAVVQGGLAVSAEIGPTHDQQPVFCWSHHPLSDTPHHGHPDCYNAGPVDIRPSPEVVLPSPNLS